MYKQSDKSGYKRVLEKIQQKTLVYGEKTLMAEFRLEQGADLPRHSHAHEQTGYLVSGELTLTIGDEPHQVRPGDSWCIAGGVEHQAKALEDSVAIEVFSPVREDFIAET